MKPYEVLEKAREIIRLRRNWCKGDYALNREGEPVPTNDPRAVQFCMLGALERVGAPHKQELRSRVLLNDAIGLLGRSCSSWEGIDGFNDSCRTTHKDVLKAFDLAIERAKEKVGRKK